MGEILREEEKGSLSDYLVSVLEQAIPCRATEDDVKRKNRKFDIGFPGVTCRNCLGADGGGRYFFSTVESLTTAYTILENHLLKCSATPAHVKEKIILSKPLHSQQRKALKSGSQAAFFSRLWRRLRSSTISEQNGAHYMLDGFSGREENTPVKSEMLGNDEAALEEFTDHRQVLDSVRLSTYGKYNQDLQEALKLYYCCLEYGGRVWNTSSMPKNFSAEWLLSKVLSSRYKEDNKDSRRGRGYG
jgi:hypothetical protein